MELVRIGDKVISKERIYQKISDILDLRAGGLSQQEVAEQLDVDRSLISRLETIGEVRKGKKLALVGFPIQNKQEIEAIAQAEGVDFCLVMTERERLDFAVSRNGAELMNYLMTLIAKARECDSVIFIGSDMRLKMAKALVGSNVFGIEIGASPLSEDKHVDPAAVRQLIRNLKQ